MENKVKRFFLWMWLLIKSQLKSPAMLGFLVIVPLCAIIADGVMPQSQTERVKIGIVTESADDTDDVARTVAARLIKGDYSITFCDVSSKDELIKELMAGKLQMGYIFTEDFQKKLETGDYEDSIIVISTSNNLINTAANEVVFSELFKIYAEDIAINYIESSDIFKDIRDKAMVTVSEMYEKYGESDRTFYLQIETISENDNTDTSINPAAGSGFPLRNVLGVFVFVAGIYGGVCFLNDRKKGVFLALRGREASAGRVLYAFVPTFLFSLSAELALLLTHTGQYPDEAVKMFVYVISITVFVSLLTVIIRNDKIMIAFIPVATVCSFVFCPVFINLETIIWQVKYINRLLLPYYYII